MKNKLILYLMKVYLGGRYEQFYHHYQFQFNSYTIHFDYTVELDKLYIWAVDSKNQRTDQITIEETK